MAKTPYDGTRRAAREGGERGASVMTAGTSAV